MLKTAQGWLADSFADSEWRILGAPGDADKEFAVQFKGTHEGGREKANAAFNLLKLGRGRWKPLFCTTVADGKERVYVSPDKNQKQKVSEMFARRLAQKLSDKFDKEF
eukprot:8054628-Karenia_brevis.AAC.1